MDFPIPVKGDNPVCAECKNCFPHIFNGCMLPCSHLVSWAQHEASAEIARKARLYATVHEFVEK